MGKYFQYGEVPAPPNSGVEGGWKRCETDERSWKLFHKEEWLRQYGKAADRDGENVQVIAEGMQAWKDIQRYIGKRREVGY